MRPTLILADDLTGAADTAARCRSAGLPATIFLHPPQPPLPEGVLAFTSDSRHLSPLEAARRVREAVEPLGAADALWYKKIDSTLRGNLGSELDALLDRLDAPAAVVCPAFPAQGRGLRDGYLVAPNLPPVTVHLPSLLRTQSHRRVVAISLADVRSGKVEARMRELWKREGADVTTEEALLFVADALEDDDLERILDAVEAALPDALLCGSAGLIGAWARRQDKGTGRQGARERGRRGDMERGQAVGESAPVLVVVGSGSEMAHRQIGFLKQDEPEVGVVVVTPERAAAETATPIDASRRVWVLHQPPPAPDAVLEGPGARQRAQLLADVAAAAVQRLRPGRLVLVGGDTAVHTLAKLGVDRLVVEAELLPGMPLCTAQDATGRPFQVVMKPGSFGDERTLVTLQRTFVKRKA